MSSQEPLYFSHRESVEGNGFVAAVTMRGRCLVACEKRADDLGDAWVFSGVQPAAVSAEGDSIPSAFAGFRERLKDVLFGLADDARDFAHFQSLVEAFFNEVDSDEQVWLSRAAEIRAGKNADQAVASLQRKFLETAPAVTIENVLGDGRTYVPSPTNNVASEIFSVDQPAA